MVFFKKEYGSMKEATLHSDGLAVLAFFFKIARPNPAYDEFATLLGTITKPHSTASFIHPLPLRELMLAKMNEYYVYNGSLTTPPCLEIVTWLDFYDPIEISHDQVSELLIYNFVTTTNKPHALIILRIVTEKSVVYLIVLGDKEFESLKTIVLSVYELN